MAKLFFTVTIILFLFSVSHARTPLIKSENGVVDPSSVPEDTSSDNNITYVNAISLPSEKNVDKESEPATATVVPLTRVSFRPINRHFLTRSSLPLRTFRRPCRHHHSLQGGPLKQRMEISYGDDMVVSSGENSDFNPLILHGGPGKFNSGKVKFHHHHHHDDDSDSDSDSDDDDKFSKLASKRYGLEDDRSSGKDEFFKKNKHFRRCHHRHHHDDKDEEKEKKKGGFMKRVHKFLDDLLDFD